MGAGKVNRRLAAILAADVAGYTRRMEADSEGTVAAWQDAREDVVKPSVGEFSGKIVKLTGDGFLVEFATVQDAVNCAIAMQRGLASSSLDFRIGINLGDIMVDDQGQIQEVVVEVGGFLGLGEKPVAIPFDQMSVLRSEAGEVRVFIEATEEELESMQSVEQ